jgi:hypothetical protein
MRSNINLDNLKIGSSPINIKSIFINTAYEKPEGSQISLVRNEYYLYQCVISYIDSDYVLETNKDGMSFVVLNVK